MAQAKAFYEDLLNGPDSEAKKKLRRAILGFSAAFAMGPNAAFAADPPAGNVTFTAFLNGVKDHQIERVQILDAGRSASFINSDGFKGFVNLIPDPNLLQTLQDNGVDVSAIA